MSAGVRSAHDPDVDGAGHVARVASPAGIPITVCERSADELGRPEPSGDQQASYDRQDTDVGAYDGRSTVMTGGSSGTGLATARLLLEAGARVLVTGRNEAALAAARDDLGVGVLTVASDTAAMADIDALAERVASEFGTFDASFVNAGVSTFAPFESMSEQMYDEVLAVNAKGPYFTVQRLAPLLAPGSGSC